MKRNYKHFNNLENISFTKKLVHFKLMHKIEINFILLSAALAVKLIKPISFL